MKLYKIEISEFQSLRVSEISENWSSSWIVTNWPPDQQQKHQAKHKTQSTKHEADLYNV